jgi:hypothetical protein
MGCSSFGKTKQPHDDDDVLSRRHIRPTASTMRHNLFILQMSMLVVLPLFV